jgi:hypothetical protein
VIACHAGLGQRLRVIKARAVAVDAEAKVVQLPDGAVVPYDILVLAHGLQESAQRDLVTKAGKDLLPDASDLADWNSPEVDIVAELTKAPSDMEEEATDLNGFVSLSSDNASDELADAVSKLGDNAVVIVGGGLDALAAARRLLDLGVAASNIKIACENDQLEPLGDQVIDRVVAQSLEVSVEYSLKFAELVRDGGALSAARFARPVQPDDAPAPAPPQEDDVEAWVERPATPPPEVVDLPCGLVVGASTPAVAADAAALVDYPLTVDSTFKTCDDSIYAAGRHVAGQERYNSLELGACLAQSLLARLTDSSVEAPDFRKARAVSATLPGGLFYCRAALPTVPLDATALPTGMLGNDEVCCPRPPRHRRDPEFTPSPQAQALLEKSSGVHALRDLAAARDKYSILKVDGSGLLCEIIYLGKAPVEPRNLAAVVGRQEAHLNGAWAAYERGVVDDWVAFLREDWCSAVRHDRFQGLHDALAKMIREDEFGRDLIQQLVGEADAGRDAEAIRQLREKAVGVGGGNLPEKTRKLLEGAVLGYLRKNRGLLPRFSLAEREAAA